MKVHELMGLLRWCNEDAEVYLSCDYHSEYNVEGTMVKADTVSVDNDDNMLVIYSEPLDKE